MATLQGKEFKPIYFAAALFVDQVLRQRGSLFSPEQPVWTQVAIDDLYNRFVLQPDTSDASFEEKFKKQLAEASPATIQLAAELLFVHLLPAGTTGGDRKRELIRMVLSWSQVPVPLPTALDAALDIGIVSEGMGFRLYRPFLLQFLLEFVRKWWNLSDGERAVGLSDPWVFKQLASSIEVHAAHSQREILLHLVHPETFEPIVSRKHKQQIADAFTTLADCPADEDVDKRLLMIHEKLAAQEGREISFYDPKIIFQWQPGADPWAQFVKYASLFYRSPEFEEAERNYKLRLAELAKPAIAALSDAPESVEPLKQMLRRREQNIVRWQDADSFIKWYPENLPQSHLAVKEITAVNSSTVDRIRGMLSHLPKDVVKSPASRTTVASLFLFALDPHDTIVFRARPFEWAYGRVDHPLPPADADEATRYEHALNFLDRLMTECEQRGLKLRDRLDAQGIVWAMAKWPDRPSGIEEDQWTEFTHYRGGGPPVIDDGEDEGGGGVITLGLGSVQSDPIGRLLLRRKNAVLYGPPGTGKTHASIQLAEKWRREFGQNSVVQVTFHPSYSYEDFIEGFRPNSEGRFELRDGIFVTACNDARRDARRSFLLLIDELNRGDVARIFGELITLVEPDKRNADVSRKLPYSQRELWVPPNLHILATMNTADRSISLLDIAIRRRFCFVEYRPDSTVIANSPAHHQSVGELALADLMDAINRRLQSIGVDRDRAIGHSHFLVASSESRPLDVIRDRLRYDILPLVEEYCYADRMQMGRVFDRLVDDAGQANEEVLTDDIELVNVLTRIVESDGTAGGSV